MLVSCGAFHRQWSCLAALSRVSWRRRGPGAVVGGPGDGIGLKHPDVAMVLENYARLLRAIGRDGEAAELETRVEQVRDKQEAQ